MDDGQPEKKPVEIVGIFHPSITVSFTHIRGGWVWSGTAFHRSSDSLLTPEQRARLFALVEEIEHVLANGVEGMDGR